MLVFRPGRRAHYGSALLQALLPLLRRLPAAGASSSSGPLPEALLRCGELECGLADLESPLTASVAAATDALAEILLGGSVPLFPVLDSLECMQPPESVSVSPPEGFAYYALNPLQYAELAVSLPASGAAAVVGIRTIGTTLSAVVAAALRRRGMPADRITVRPDGHPFDRRTAFTPEQRRWIAAQRSRRAQFLVVDEGPGLSGSSFLSVGDALLEQGVPRASVAFLCGAQPDPARLCARDAARRWQQFRSFAVRPHPALPPGAAMDLGAGLWRRHLFDVVCNWPSSWITMERSKFLSSDGTRLFKFEGLGHFGRKAGERARALAEAGFSPAGEDAGSGFVSYQKQDGFPASRADLCPAMLDRLAAYCAFRASALSEPACSRDLAAMAAWNLHEEFGVPCQPASLDLEVKAPVAPDGRMQPHEWLLTGHAILKTDAASHGDDHFYPGPADIAWDLAGAIVEWDMGADAAQHLLRRYVQLTGDRVHSRLPAWLQAYTAFRLGYCKMAAEALAGTAEQERLLRDYRRYRARAAISLTQTATA